tara:strand:+ start:6221 stop:6631 length:411 start_codon:yes stop_codon:yes gene_type:complete
MWKDRIRESAVAEFHQSMGHQIDGPFSLKELELRMKLIKEECAELECESDILHMQFIRNGRTQAETRANFLKELGDLQYVISGCAVALGLPINIAFNRIHKSNMSKLDDNGKPILREDGKVLKGPNYKEPQMKDLV